MPEDIDPSSIPEELRSLLATHKGYIENLGQFLSIVLTMETALSVALAYRFVPEEDRRLFSSSILGHVPLGSKVDALEDVLRAAGHDDPAKAVAGARRAVERRNQLAHQSASLDLDYDTGHTTITLFGRRGKETVLSTQDLDRWVAEVRTARDEVVEAAGFIGDRFKRSPRALREAVTRP